MNDKCAAGTGRFLEVMAGVLDVKLDELGELDAKSTEVTPISSTCTVFAESEVISCMAKKIPLREYYKRYTCFLLLLELLVWQEEVD